METLEERIKRVLRDEVAIVPYDPSWPQMFEEEKRHLMECLPPELIRRIDTSAAPQFQASEQTNR